MSEELRSLKKRKALRSEGPGRGRDYLLTQGLGKTLLRRKMREGVTEISGKECLWLREQPCKGPGVGGNG